MTTEPPDPGAPSELSHYRLGRLLGSGGMGAVYEATDGRSGARVAIKLLHAHLAADQSFRDRFNREAHVASLLRSPYTVPLLDSGVDEGRYFLVTRFVEGETLRDALRPGPLEPARALRVAAQVARSLEEAELRGIVHRDIKPENVMLAEPDGTAQVLDFGIARQTGSVTLTGADSFVGTPLYAAPEAAGGRTDHRSDIYSLGVTLYHMLTGRPPFEGEPLELLRQHREEPPPEGPLATLPRAVAEIVLRCLAKSPADRPQSASELAGLLERLSEQSATRGDEAVEITATEVLERDQRRPGDTSTVSITLGEPSVGGRFLRAGRGSRYELVLRNDSDDTVEFRLDATNGEETMAFSLPDRVAVEPHDAETVSIGVRPRRRRWWGKSESHRFQISASGAGGGPPIVVSGEFEERPERWVPYAGGAFFSVAAIGIIFAALSFLGGGDGTAPPDGPARPPESGRESVSVILGALIEADGLDHIWGGDGLTEASERAGRSCRELLSNGSDSRYAFFKVDDGFIQATATPVLVTVEYFDEGDFQWWVEGDHPSANEMATSAPVRLEGTGTWRTHTFALEDATFGTVDYVFTEYGIAVDFRIAATEAEPALCIREVTVRRLGPTLRLRLATTSDAFDARPADVAVLGTVTVVEPRALPDGWVATTERLHLEQPLANASAGREIELVVDIRLTAEALKLGAGFDVQNGGIGSSRVQFFAVTGDFSAQLVKTVTIQGTELGAADVTAKELQEAFPDFPGQPVSAAPTATPAPAVAPASPAATAATTATPTPTLTSTPTASPTRTPSPTPTPTPTPTPVVLEPTQPGGSAPGPTITGGPVITAVINLGGETPHIRLSGWRPDVELRVEVWDGPARNQLLGTGTLLTDDEGVANAFGLTVARGMFIVATDGVTTKQLTVVGLTAVGDAASDVVSGTAPAGSSVQVVVEKPGEATGPLAVRTVTADGVGHFSVDFSDPVGGPTADIVIGAYLSVSVGDLDNDRTHVQFKAQ